MRRAANRAVLLSCLSLMLLACSNRTPAVDQAGLEATPHALNAAPKVGDFAILAANSAKVLDRATVAAGDIGVISTHGGPFLENGFQLALVNGARIEASRSVLAYAVELLNGAVAGDVQTNHLKNIGGSFARQFAFPTMPVFPAANTSSPGNSSVTVPKGQARVLAPGRYAVVSVDGILRIGQGGSNYDFASLLVNNDARVEVLGPVQLRIAGRLAILDRGHVVAASGASLRAGDIRIEVSGRNGNTGGLGEIPKAAVFGNDAEFRGLLLVPNGTVQIGQRDSVVGALAGRDVYVDIDAHVLFESGFSSAICAPTNCDDANPCTTDACINGTCIHTPVAAGTSCSDGNACNGAETCTASATCVAGPSPLVDDGNPCTTDTCDPTAGVQHTPVTSGTECADENACDGAETCNASGVCVAGSPPQIDDHNPCTADSCDPATGVQHTPLSGCTAKAIQDAIQQGASEIDIDHDNETEWFLVRPPTGSTLLRAVLDRDHNGQPEAVWEVGEDHEFIALDRNQDGVYELERRVETLQSGSGPAKITTIEDTDRDYKIDRVIIETPDSGRVRVDLSFDENEDGIWGREESSVRDSVLYAGDWRPPSDPATACDPQYLAQLGEIQYAQYQAIEEGAECLHAEDPALADLLLFYLSAQGFDYSCEKRETGCASAAVNDWSVDPVSRWPRPRITVFQPTFFEEQKCGTMKGTLFHEMLHFLLPVPPEHNSGNVQDPVYGCATYCFEDAGDICAYKNCMGTPPCPASRRNCNKCDRDTGQCVPDQDGILCGLAFQAGECREAQNMCKNGSCEPVNKQDGTTCSDGNLCTQGDACQSGTCLGGAPTVCAPQPDPCFEPFECQPDTGCLSVSLPSPDGSPCGEGRVCANGRCCEQNQTACDGVCEPLKKVWLFTGSDGCGRLYKIYIIAAPDAEVSIGHAHTYPAWEDTYDCDGDGVGEVGSPGSPGEYLSHPFVDGQCVGGYCGYASGFYSPHLVELNGQDPCHFPDDGEVVRR
jgi:hypothetical protein